MTDPAGGRETEIEAVAKALFHWDHPSVDDRTRGPVYAERAHMILAALDAVRSGSAARNQEDEDEVERLRRELAICREDRAFKHRQVETLAKRADAARSPQNEDHDA
jgi:hypothetical protein